MIFASDNWAGAHPLISESITHYSTGFAPAYGSSALDQKVARTFNEIFEREVAVFFVATGTAANALALASVNRPGGVVFCHREAHVIEDECGAPEWFTGGARLHAIDGALGKMDPAGLQRGIDHFPADFVHAGQPMAVTVTQATEAGTLYSLGEIDAISAIAKRNGLPLHMDGARFANAMVSLGCTPAEMTWKRGVDILSFGGTKNGCWCAEALVFMNPDDAKQAPFLRKRAAQLFSKSRFIAAQFEAYFENNLWLELARHSNAAASELATHIRNSKSMHLAWEPQANEVFAWLKKSDSDRLRAAGAVFYDWHGPASQARPHAGEVMVRMVTSFATDSAAVKQFAELL